MRTTLPDEQGWYWCKMLTTGRWHMAFVDTGEEAVLFYGDIDETGQRRCPYNYDEDHIRSEFGEIEWHGPITCPGGDFGSETVLPSESLHQEARDEKKVIAITYLDFYYCRDEGHGASMTISRLVTRDEAQTLINAELPSQAE